MTLQEQFESGMMHHRAGRLAEAERIYREILVRQPNHAEALHLLGALASQVGQPDVAVELIQRAIKILPDFAEAHYNLGIALAGNERMDQAIASYRHAIRINPDYAQAHYNLGNVLHGLGQFDEAVASYSRAIQINPDYTVAHFNLGNALKEKGQLDEAIASYQTTIRLNPEYADAHNNLGIALRDNNRPDEAIASFGHAIRIKPDFAEAHSNLGNVLQAKGQLDAAIESHRHAILLKPDFAEAHGNLGNALKDKNQLDDAIAAYQQALRLQPDFADVQINLGNALGDKGQIDEAIVSYRQALQSKPDCAIAHSNLVFTLPFHPAFDARMIFEENRRWNDQFAQPFTKLILPHISDRNPDRRLRIGYISPNFRDHCQSFFTIPLLSNHDRKAFEIICYSDVREPDSVTQRIRRYADEWRSITRMKDADVARQIREDRLDILIDLTMHMANGRPLVFARKPAPVQAAWLAYPGTTGLSAMDYRLTDPYLDPPELDDQFYSETSIRLPDTFWCYDPLTAKLNASTLPALTHKIITFGCLNSFSKVNEHATNLWAQVLKAVDRSRLILLCPEGNHRQPLLALLQREGIQSDRIELVTRRPRLNYLEFYNRIDIGLDTFPSNGHTTSLDSFWMGIPVVTLAGNTVVGRAGLSQLTNLGLPELIAHTPHEYMQIAARLAEDLPQLAELRRTLRSKMEASPLMDAPRFARNIEAAYRQMWRNWCEQTQNTGLQCPTT
jgi:predicted O-linked N-acetylglucosamine transferase (SPINDLY family)